MTKFKSIPSEVIVCGQVYKVVFVDDDELSNNCGEIRWKCGKIWLSDSLDEPRALQTLLHEILHAIHSVSHFSKNLDEDDEDKAEHDVINRLEQPLFQVLKENKLIFHD